jgi:hypothetical protein
VNYPQQGFYPQHAQQPTPAPQTQQTHLPQMQPPMPLHGAAAHIQAQADRQAFGDACMQQKRTPVVRDRIDDGTHHIFIKNCECKPSTKDGRLFILWEFEVIGSTVATNIGRSFSYPMFFSTTMQMRDMSDVAKDIFGEETVRQWPQQNVSASDAAVYVAQTVKGKCCTLYARRNMKNGETYDTAFINHTFRSFAADPSQLPPLPVAAPAPNFGMAPQPQMQPPQMQPPQMQPPQMQPPQMQPQGFPPPQMQPPQMQPPQMQPPASFPAPPQGFPPPQYR